MDEYKIGIYIRLSLADADLAKKEGKTESESISHQRDLIHNYLKSHKEFKKCSIEEFFDDGYSGTNFKRPSFEKLLDKVKTGEINLIIVKDFSRFGRDYIELGEYLERIFPLLNVRFISINDNYDSDDYKGTTGGLDIIMKNIVYAYYSKDLSAKVMSAKRARERKGEWNGGNVPYGLMVSPKTSKKLVKDACSASIVRRIFDMAISGMGTAEIARILNDEGVLTPGEYYRQKFPNRKIFMGNKSGPKFWTATTILNILGKQQYYGANVGHKRVVTSPCSGHTAKVSDEEVIVVENMHEAIVSKKEWQQAQKVINRIGHRSRTVRDYPLKGVVRCGYCHHTLQYYTGTYKRNFICNSQYTTKDSRCLKEKLDEDIVNDVVFTAIKKVFALANEMSSGLERKREQLSDEKASLQAKITEKQKRLKKLEKEKYANVDAFMAEEITKDEFYARRDKVDVDISKLSEEIKKLSEDLDHMNAANDDEVKSFVDRVDIYSSYDTLTNDMVRAFIKNVYVYDAEHIEIEWNFNDEIIKNCLK